VKRQSPRFGLRELIAAIYFWQRAQPYLSFKGPRRHPAFDRDGRHFAAHATRAYHFRFSLCWFCGRPRKQHRSHKQVNGPKANRAAEHGRFVPFWLGEFLPVVLGAHARDRGRSFIEEKERGGLAGRHHPLSAEE
jgi:hypothetical protein